MSKKLIISVIIITITIVLGSWAFVVSSNLTKNMKEVSNDPDVEGEKANVEELIITETREGNKFWEVYATSGRYDNNKNLAVLTDVKGNFYKNNKVVLSFEAPLATYNDKNKEIKLTGGSKAATDDQTLISAKELSWAGSNDEINARGNVKILKSQNFLTSGDASIFNTDLTKFKMIGQSRTNVYTK